LRHSHPVRAIPQIVTLRIDVLVPPSGTASGTK
jgi:hypothetical protein